jgi:hypothetical protein
MQETYFVHMHNLQTRQSIRKYPEKDEEKMLSYEVVTTESMIKFPHRFSIAQPRIGAFCACMGDIFTGRFISPC